MGKARVDRSWLKVSPDFRFNGLGARLLRMEPKSTAVTPETWGQIKESH